MKQTSNNKKQFKVADFAAAINLSENVIRRWIKSPIDGQVYDSKAINYIEVKNQLKKRFTDEEIFNRLGCDLNSFEFIINSKEFIESLPIDEMNINSLYILRSYHYEHNVKLISKIKYNDEELFIFENQSLNDSSKKDQFKVLSRTELSQDRWTIKVQ